MRAPSRNLSLAVTAAGGVVAAVAAILQIVLSHQLEGTVDGPGDTFMS